MDLVCVKEAVRRPPTPEANTPLRVLVLLNVADSQSVPLELASRMARSDRIDVQVAAFNPLHTHFPTENFGTPVIELGARSTASPRAIWRLWRLIARTRPDIVHVHLWPSGIWGTMLARLAGAHVIKTEHNDLAFQSKVKRVANVAMYPLTRLLICNSQATLDSLGPIEWRRVGGRAVVIYNGVDFSGIDAISKDRATVRKEIGIAEELLIGAVGRLVTQKNFARLIRGFAMAIADPRLAGAKLVLVGEGGLRGELEAQVALVGLDDRVIFTGGVTRRRVYELLAAMDVFVVPSLWEGFCNAAVEAAGSGLPMAAADIGTLREVLGDHAQYFDPSDENAIGRALAHLAGKGEAVRKSYGEAGRAWARSRYAIGLAAERYEEAFRGLAQAAN